MSLPDYFWTKVEKTETCWNWMANKVQGYGRFGSVGSETYLRFGTSLAYRIAWCDLNGPVPDGLELDHTCNNPACVERTAAACSRRGSLAQGGPAGRTACPNGHPIEGNRVPHYDVDHGDRCLPCRRKSNRESVRRQRARKTPVGALVTWNVRVWAWSNGLEVSRKGPLPRHVVDAYIASLPTEREARAS